MLLIILILPCVLLPVIPGERPNPMHFVSLPVPHITLLTVRPANSTLALHSVVFKVPDIRAPVLPVVGTCAMLESVSVASDVVDSFCPAFVASTKPEVVLPHSHVFRIWTGFKDPLAISPIISKIALVKRPFEVDHPSGTICSVVLKLTLENCSFGGYDFP